MITLRSYTSELVKSLAELYQVDEAASVAAFYISASLQLKNTDVFLRQSDILTDEEIEKLNYKRHCLLSGEPVQYVVGAAHFYGLEYFVDKNVLIPRQETEILVDSIIKRFRNYTNLQILDIGTGSGCIAISLKRFLPQAQIWALDISENALAVCSDNAKKNEVEINTVLFDILGNSKFPIETKFDIIVSNPPYVLESEKQLMHKNVTEFEPDSALYVPDSDPLIFYRQISFFAAKYLKSNGELFFEINEKFAQQVSCVTLENGFKSNNIIEDLNKKHRFVHSFL